ncbi:MAG: hypothetical protein HYV63_12325 [Candidatus Schekmanbacteria bacterium]|nr:hypothetical protein [Candidatus Schekmanbacteria bacterium]
MSACEQKLPMALSRRVRRLTVGMLLCCGAWACGPGLETSEAERPTAAHRTIDGAKPVSGRAAVTSQSIPKSALVDSQDTQKWTRRVFVLELAFFLTIFYALARVATRKLERRIADPPADSPVLDRKVD